MRIIILEMDSGMRIVILEVDGGMRIVILEVHGRWNEDRYSRGGWRNEVSQYALYNRAVRVAINVRGNSNIEEWPRGTLVSNVLSKLVRSLPS